MSGAVEPIAVIGMACRLPGARNLGEFWRNLVEGRESISFRSAGELAEAGVAAERIADRDYVPAVPIMPDADRFDADLFGMTAAEARICDPQIRAFLETCHATVENAGYDPFALPDSVGVFGANGPGAYLHHVLTTRPELIADTAGMAWFTLNNADYLSTLVSYKLNLRGPSMTVLSACSGSLVAVHMGCQALRQGECDAALAGGASIELPLGHGHRWTPGGVLSRDGHCRPFDAAASGTVFGSGVGAVMLKRLDDALADGDRVMAVIRGSAVNNDGRDKVSFSAPSIEGQSAVIEEAMAISGAAPGDIDHVEAHATGTELGDPIEVVAISAAYAALSGGAPSPGRTLLGSVKSNIGHLNAAAGIAGLIKTVLMVDRETIAPTINVTAPNPRLALDGSPFELATSARPWPRGPGRVRTAAVSSLGIGGTNVHMVLSDGAAPPPRARERKPRLLVWSARDEEGTETLRARLAEYFSAEGEADFADAAGTLQRGRTPHPVRRACVAGSAAEAAERLGEDGSGVVSGRARRSAKRALMFPGQDAHSAESAAALYGTDYTFTAAMDECLRLFTLSGLTLAKPWLGESPPGAAETIQPLLFSMEYALARMWCSWGFHPEAVVGHSAGELAAAAVAGVFDLPDAVRLVAARTEAMARHPFRGGMLAVAGDAQRVRELLPPQLAVAVVNGPEQTVVSGPPDELDTFAALLRAERMAFRALRVPHAFHHPGWRPAADRFAEVFAEVTANEPAIPLYSGLTGRPLSAAEARDPGFWTAQLTMPVLFGPALRALTADGEWTLLEGGPGRTLTALARRLSSAGDGRVRVVAGLGAGDGVEAALRAAAELWTDGVTLDWDAMGQPPPGTRRPVPGYPYRRERYWVDPPDSGSDPVGTAGQSGEAVSPVTVLEWAPGPAPRAGAASGTALVVLPNDPDRAMTVVRAVERAGYRTVRVRPADSPGETAEEFLVRLGDSGDLARVTDTLAGRGVHPGLFVHAAAFGTPGSGDRADLAARLDAAFFSLLSFATAALTRPPGVPVPRFAVMTSGAVDASGSDPLDPARASVLGLARTLAVEAPGTPVTVIDVGGRTGVPELARELARSDPPLVTALRGHRRWVPAERSLPLGPPVRQPLRERGTYLITGGFGGLGLALALRLARSGARPRLVLMGRRDPAAAGADVDAPGAARARAVLAELAVLGAETLTVAGDVAAPGAVAAAFDAVRARFGTVNGVFHLAGIAGGGMIPFRGPEKAAQVLAPKVGGTLLLAEAMADGPPLDFVVLFGSRAGVDGLVGSADYAAANAFLEAAAEAVPFNAERVLNIAWPGWRDVGMFARRKVDLAGLADRVARPTAARPDPGSGPGFTWEEDVTAATHWTLDEHRLDGVPLMPGSAYLDIVVRLFTERVAAPGQAVELTDALFRAPLSGHEPRRLRVVFTPTADGSAHAFTVSSFPAGDRGGSGEEHVTGRVAAVAQEPRKVELRALLDGMGEGTAGAEPVNRPLALGPRWHNLVEVRQVGDEILLHLRLLAGLSADPDEHTLHPALLDRATAGVCDSAEADFVPFIYGRLVVHEPLPAEFYSHIRRARSEPDTVGGDIEMIGLDGRVLATVEQFTMRRFTPAPEPSRQGFPAEDGPEEGLSLLLQLLARDTPRAVMVRPSAHAEPAPVPEPAISKKALVVTDTGRSTPEDDAGPPSLSGLWRQVIGRAPAGDDDDFFDAGGNSLSAVELIGHIRANYGLELSLGLLFKARTYGALRGMVENGAVT